MVGRSEALPQRGHQLPKEQVAQRGLCPAKLSQGRSFNGEEVPIRGGDDVGRAGQAIDKRELTEVFAGP